MMLCDLPLFYDFELRTVSACTDDGVSHGVSVWVCVREVVSGCVVSVFYFLASFSFRSKKETRKT